MFLDDLAMLVMFSGWFGNVFWMIWQCFLDELAMLSGCFGNVFWMIWVSRSLILLCFSGIDFFFDRLTNIREGANLLLSSSLLSFWQNVVQKDNNEQDNNKLASTRASQQIIKKIKPTNTRLKHQSEQFWAAEKNTKGGRGAKAPRPPLCFFGLPKFFELLLKSRICWL